MASMQARRIRSLPVTAMLPGPAARDAFIESDAQDLQPETITKLCGNSSCPTVYHSGRGTILVQGYDISGAAAGLDVPHGESVVEIPAELLAEAARLASGQT